jgi:hypothetical protein
MELRRPPLPAIFRVDRFVDLHTQVLIRLIIFRSIIHPLFSSSTISDAGMRGGNICH